MNARTSLQPSTNFWSLLKKTIPIWLSARVTMLSWNALPLRIKWSPKGRTGNSHGILSTHHCLNRANLKKTSTLRWVARMRWVLWQIWANSSKVKSASLTVSTYRRSPSTILARSTRNHSLYACWFTTQETFTSLCTRFRPTVVSTRLEIGVATLKRSSRLEKVSKICTPSGTRSSTNSLAIKIL